MSSNARAIGSCSPGSIVPAPRTSRHSNDGNRVAARRNGQPRNSGHTELGEIRDCLPVATAFRIERLQDAPFPDDRDTIRRPVVILDATWHLHEAFLLPGFRIE